MKRVEDVLCKGWENYLDGQKLKADGDSFKQKLNTQEVFDEWANKVFTDQFLTLRKYWLISNTSVLLHVC
jgi:hypothetical protein